MNTVYPLKKTIKSFEPVNFIFLKRMLRDNKHNIRIDLYKSITDCPTYQVVNTITNKVLFRFKYDFFPCGVSDYVETYRWRVICTIDWCGDEEAHDTWVTDSPYDKSAAPADKAVYYNVLNLLKQKHDLYTRYYLSKSIKCQMMNFFNKIRTK